MVEWTKEDTEAALKESWLLLQRPDGLWEIQRYDDGAKSWSDAQAVAHCLNCAEEGSFLHAKACALHGSRWI